MTSSLPRGHEASSICTSGGVRKLDARVEQDIGDVDRDVDEHVAAGYDKHHPLHDREIAIEDAVERQRTDTRQAEDDFGDDGAAEQTADLQTDKRHRRDQGILQRVTAYDARLAQTLGARRRHEWCLQ